MTVQSQINLDTTPFIIKELPRASRKDDSILLTDAARSGDIAPYTVMAQIAASLKWVPWTDVAAVDGSAIPSGIFLPSNIQGAITEASIKAGDVPDIPILFTGAQVDEDKLVFENSLDLDTTVDTGVAIKTAREILLEKNIVPVTTYSPSKAQT